LAGQPCRIFGSYSINIADIKYKSFMLQLLIYT